MDRRISRILRILSLCAAFVALAPVNPVGEPRAPQNVTPAKIDQAAPVPDDAADALIPPRPNRQSSVADASTIEKLRLLFSR